MAATSDNGNKEFFSSLITNIKSYSGSDPLRPWLQGIKKMKEKLLSHALKEKLPRFLQKCIETFETDQRYRNDLRYIRVWIQLMDYVDDAKVLLRKMEKNHIGAKRATFYSAYALYYEKQKKFQEAEKMFLLGVQNLAEPAVELQKSYEQFLHRMKLRGQRRTTELTRLEKRMISEGRKTEKGEASKVFYIPTFGSEDHNQSNSYKGTTTATDDTIAVKRFVGKAMVEKTETENALHHGLVDPTINMKDAMNTISDMFKEPLDLEQIAKRKSRQNKAKQTPSDNIAFKIWTEGDDDESGNDVITDKMKGKDGEDTVVRKFMGSTDNDDDRVENACHHGLVDATVNMKEAMDDINGMFGGNVNLMRTKGQTGQEGLMGGKKGGNEGFFILSDDALEEDFKGCDLFEPTICTKKAMADINQMFGTSLDF